MWLLATPRVADNICTTGAKPVDEDAPEMDMRRHIFAIFLSLSGAVISGAIFLASLMHQFALVEVAASVLTSLQVFFLSSTIADVLERKTKPNAVRSSWVILFTVFLIAYYSFIRYFR